MKKFFTGCAVFAAVLVAIVVIGITAVFYLTSGAVDTADAFFTEVAAGNFSAARNFLSEEFKATTSAAELEAFLSKSSLLDYNEANWHNRSIENNTGSLEGEIITQSGGSIPLKMDFVKESDAWKILFIEKQNAGIATSSESVIPTKAESAELLRGTTREFGQALNNRDFSDFHAGLASEFQDKFSPDELMETFGTFIEQEIDLTLLEQYEPMFTLEPALSSEGVLQLEGYFPTTPSRTHFSYTYVVRSGSWKLLGINVDLKPVEGEDG